MSSLTHPLIQGSGEPQLKKRGQERLGPSGIHPIPGMQCVTFNPQTLTKEELKNGPKMFGDLHWLYAREHSQNDGYVLKIIKHYGMNASCLINDSYTPFHFMLVDGRAPSGKMFGEDCLPHHTANLYLVYLGPGPIRDGDFQHGYRIADRAYGPNGISLYSFNEKESALAAMEAIRIFSLTQECYYVRPHAAFVYMKAE